MNEQVLLAAHALIVDAEAAARRARERGDMLGVTEAIAVLRWAEHYARIASGEVPAATSDGRLS